MSDKLAVNKIIADILRSPSYVSSPDAGHGEAGIIISPDPVGGGLILYGADDTYDPETGTGTYQILMKLADGKFYAGDGEVVIGDDGISLDVGTGSPNMIKWMTGAYRLGSIRNSFSTNVSSLVIDSNTDEADTGATSSNITLQATVTGASSSDFNVRNTGSARYAQFYTGGGGSTYAGVSISDAGSDIPDSLLHLRGSAPTFRMEDSTGGATSFLLTVDGNKATFENTSGTDTMVLDLVNSRVGIGTASPSSLLQLSGTAPTFRMEDTTGSANSLLVSVDANVATVGEVTGGTFVNFDLANERTTFGSITDLTNAARTVNIIDAGAFLRIYRITSDLDAASPSIELIGAAAVDTASGSWSSRWDMRLNAADSFIVRRRTGGDKDALTISTNGSVVVNSAAVATNATDGFLYIPSCAGVPTGVPTAFAGRTAMVWDSTNSKLYLYQGGWVAMN